jgi:hypothetical protein
MKYEVRRALVNKPETMAHVASPYKRDNLKNVIRHSTLSKTNVTNSLSSG